ncbi:MAG: hypothetical protein KBD37_09360 [Burkholderiales bacterium]|nr:hypothetical protein [Burkholderiales bacterium]
MRIQITIDDAFGNQIRSKAKDLGLSVSSYSRYILKQALKTPKLNKLDMALKEKSEEITFEEFKSQIKALKNA